MRSWGSGNRVCGCGASGVYRPGGLAVAWGVLIQANRATRVSRRKLVFYDLGLTCKLGSQIVSM